MATKQEINEQLKKLAEQRKNLVAQLQKKEKDEKAFAVSFWIVYETINKMQPKPTLEDLAKKLEKYKPKSKKTTTTPTVKK